MQKRLRSASALLVVLGLGTLTATATAAADGPPCSPPGSPRITFARDNHIFTVCPDGHGLVQLTRGRSLDQQPAWSPNRQLIAFARQKASGPIHIYTMRSDGSNVHQVTAGRNDDFLPAWSPDGKQLTFTRALSTSKIYTIHADGSHLRYVTQGVAPAWSPDGSSIAISRIASNGKSGIYLVRPLGTSLERITPASISAYAADWSPNGAWLVFQVINKADGDPRQWSSDIAVIAKNGSQMQRVTQNHQGVDSFPAWSPDGEEVAFDRYAFDAKDNGASDDLETVCMPDASAMGATPISRLTTASVGRVQGTDVDW